MTGNIRDTDGGIVHGASTAGEGWWSLLRAGSAVRWWTVVAIGLLAVLLFAGGAVAADGPADIDPDTDLDGDGTEASPYIITNASELQAMRGNLTAHYELGGTINATNTAKWHNGDGFYPIGNHTGSSSASFDGDQFEGSLNGNGYAIENLTINRGDESYIGLFGKTTDSTKIVNLTLTNATVNGSAHVGTLVGDSSGDVYDVHSSGHVTIELGDGNSPNFDGEQSSTRVGGLVGLLREPGTVRNTVVGVNVTSTDNNADRLGGLVGYSRGEIWDSKATGNVEGRNGVGGVVGRNVGHIENVTATGNVTGVSSGSMFAFGGIAGYNGLDGSDPGTITRSHATGTVSASDATNVGGLVGSNNLAVNKSYATGTVEGNENVGGLIGRNSENVAIVSESYANGTVEGNENVGGFIGYIQNGEVSDSYATGSVDEGSTHVGGFVGKNDGNIERSYAVVDVPTGQNGFVGTNTGGTVTTSYWDTDATGVTTSDGGEGLSTAQMTGAAAEANMIGFAFGSTWDIVDTDTEASYPFLLSNAQEPAPGVQKPVFAGGAGTTDTPFEIADWNQLDAVRTTLDANYTLINDLDTETAGYGGDGVDGVVLDSTDDLVDGIGFTPIGSNGEFTGAFNGSGNTISDLSINTDGENDVGLFGRTDAAQIENIGLLNADITGDNHVGGLVGYHMGGTISNSYATGSVDGDQDVGGLVGSNEGTIEESYATGSVNATSSNAGGLVGNNDGTISDSYATGSVDGDQDVGGLVGVNTGQGSIEQSYATGFVDGTDHLGGLVGQNNAGTDDITDSFWDVNTTGQIESDGGTGLSTAQMTGGAAATNMEPLTASVFTVTDSYPIHEWSITDLTLTLAATEITTGDTIDTTVSLAVDDRTILASETADYTTGDDSVATVDAGTVTAEGVGSTTISASVAAASDEASLRVASAPRSSRSSRSRQRPTEVTVSESTDGDSGASDPTEPDARISVTSPVPGQTLVIEGDRAFIPGDDDESGSTDSSDAATDDGASNVRSDRLSIDINTDRDFELSVTTYESDLTRSLRRPTAQTAQSVDPLFASGAAFLGSTSAGQQVQAPETVSMAAASFESDTNTVSAGYIDVEHTLETGDISGATFEFSIRQSYLDSLGVDAEDVVLHHRVDDEWHTRETNQTDADGTHYRFVGSVSEFSVFALGTGAESFSVTEASLSESRVAPDEPVTVTATVENRGQQSHEATIELTLGGEVIDSQPVDLDGQKSTQISFEYTPTATGDYTLSVGGVEAGVLTVGETVESSLWWLLAVLAAVVAAAVLWRRRH